MKRVRRRLVAMTLNSLAVLGALLLVCVTLGFFVLTATAAQAHRSIQLRGLSAVPAGHAVSGWQDVPTDWQENVQFEQDFGHGR